MIILYFAAAAVLVKRRLQRTNERMEAELLSTPDPDPTPRTRIRVAA